MIAEKHLGTYIHYIYIYTYYTLREIYIMVCIRVRSHFSINLPHDDDVRE